MASTFHLDRGAQRIGVEENKAAIGTPHQRHLRADVDDAADLVRTANVPEIFRYLEHVAGHDGLRFADMSFKHSRIFKNEPQL
jgi:hypothetical protein